ncbi:hypothetical protein ACIQRS_04470 [Streptomyces termitum]|uniref:hypothetical protein n=1 Tax=Streptomyces termitum TaxID=67368 RepID=UPI001674CD44|nr:hypothetical protein [Streptomyces termitum]
MASESGTGRCFKPPPRGSATNGGTTTTVGISFGRISANQGLMLYLFGLPGQTRLMEPIARTVLHGTLGALVLVDTRDLDTSHPVLGLLEKQRVPYGVTVNRFDHVLARDPPLANHCFSRPPSPVEVDGRLFPAPEHTEGATA